MKMYQKYKRKNGICLILVGVGVLTVLMFYVLDSARPLDGYVMDTGVGHQRELLTHWEEKQKQKKRFKFSFEEEDETTLKFNEVKLMKALKEKIKQSNKEDVQENLEETSQEKEVTHPVLNILKTENSSAQDESIPCVKSATHPPVTVCLHNVSKDVFISSEIQMRRTWEPHILVQMQDILRGDPKLGFIDIGANIGFYSLVVAKMGHDVLSVEPFMDNIVVFQKAINSENLNSRIKILQNGVSGRRGKSSLILDKLNQGGIRVSKTRIACKSKCSPTVDTILMDDLNEVVTFKRAILKIDIEGGEHLAFKHPSKLFQHVYIPYVFMEWLLIREYYVNVDTVTKDKSAVVSMIAWFVSHDYTPYCLATGLKLDPSVWYGWGHDVLWKHLSNVSF